MLQIYEKAAGATAPEGRIPFRVGLPCAVLGLLILGAGIGIALLLRAELGQMRLNERVRARESISLVASSITELCQDIDRSLAEDVQRLVVYDAVGNDIHLLALRHALRETLIQQTAWLPSVISMSIFDSDGQWIISSRFNQLPAVSYNPKRPIWNTALRAPSDRSFMIGPEASPALGMPSMTIARAARAPDGRMLGAILAFVSTDDLKKTFGVGSKLSSLILLSLPDGAGIVSTSQNVQRVPAWMQGQWKETLRVGGSYFRVKDDAGEYWLVAVSGTGESRMIVTSITSEKAALAEFRQYAHTVVSLSLIALGLVLGVFGLWLRQRWMTHQNVLAIDAARERLIQSLSRDPATQLLNRAGFEQRLRERGRVQNPVALHLIGIGRFQTIKDTLGHAMADMLLLQIADRLRRSACSNGLIARVGGEDFCVAQYTDDPESIAQGVLQSLSTPFMLGDRDFLIAVSVGIIDASRADDWNGLLRDAGTAMYRARSEGHNGFCWFDAAIDRPAQTRLALEQDLRAAIGTDQLYMVYQPIYDLAAGRVTGFEALMRWKHPVHGHIGPDFFIPLATAAGLMLPIERVVKQPPLAAAAGWPEDICVSINYPAYEFKDPSLPSRVQERLHITGVASHRCIIEVTESAMLEEDAIVVSVMQELKRIGVRLALDDFGTGYASMSYLARFPFDRIKIDKGFIAAMETSEVAAAIVDATMALSRKLNLEVVAEGVETNSQMARLREMGCQYVQGYLISRPMEAVDISDFLKQFSLDSCV